MFGVDEESKEAAKRKADEVQREENEKARRSADLQKHMLRHTEDVDFRLSWLRNLGAEFDENSYNKIGYQDFL